MTDLTTKEKRRWRYMCPVAETLRLDQRLSGPADGVAGVTFTVGAESSNSINVGLQLKNGKGDDVAAVTCVLAYLSDAATGIGVTAAVPDGDVAIGTDGAIIGEITTDAVFLLQSEDDGDIDLDIGEASTGTWYLVVILPNGQLAISDAITFA